MNHKLKEDIIELIKVIYYKFNSWRYGINYGCGRCHHAQWLHGNGCSKCFCGNYVIERMY